VAPGVKLEDTDELAEQRRLRRAKNLFEYGDCESVIDVLGDFTITARVRNEDQLVEAHRMLGVCYLQLGRSAEAERELKSLLYLNPDYELDPFLNPPPVVELFERLRRELDARLEEVRKARRKVQEQKSASGRVVIERERVVMRRSPMSIWLPFGGAQWANGEPIKGVLFGVAQAVPLALNIAAFWALQSVRPEDFQLVSIPEPQGAVVMWSFWTIHLGALGLFALIYGGGVLDAWWNFEGETLVQTSEQRREDKDAEPPLGAPPPPQ